MMNVFKFLILSISFSVIVHAQAEMKFDVRVVDVKSLFDAHPDAVAINKIIEKKEGIRAENDKKVKRLREIAAKIEDLSRQIDDPNIGDADKEKLIRDRYALAKETNVSYASRKDHVWKSGNRLSDRRELRTLRQKIHKQISKVLIGLELDLVIDKSARGKSGGLFVIYSAENLDLTEMMRGMVYGADKNGMTKKEIKGLGLGLPYEKLSMASVNMVQLIQARRQKYDEEKKAAIASTTKLVREYAVKNEIHLVLDSSSESSHYSTVLTMVEGDAEITEKLLKSIEIGAEAK